MERLHRDIDGAFKGHAGGRLPGSAFGPGPGLRHYPRVNLREDQDNLYVEALLPGVEPEQVELNLLGDTLTLAGERFSADDAENSKTWHRRERAAGKFLRTVELPVAIEPDKVRAEASHGLLRVTLPKAAAAKPKKISVKVS
jgi:HSP20 family protein